MKKIKIGGEIVKQLAEEMECGFNIFVNPVTGETKSILNTDNFGGGTDEFWEEESREIDEKWEKFIKIETPSSREGFEFMESFLDKVKEDSLRTELFNALNRRSPFANFKIIVESSSHREEWFAHKRECYINYLTDHLRYSDIEVEE